MATITAGPDVWSIDDDQATITCTTDTSALVRVQYGLTAALGLETADGPPGLFHSRTLTGLAASTVYHYRLRVEDTPAYTRALAGSRPAGTGALSRLKASARALAGSRPTPTGVLTHDAPTGAIDPLTVGGLAARWRAQDLAGLSADDPVAVWASAVGGLVAAQPVLAERPLYTPSAQNGKAGLAFNGVSAHLNAGDVLGFTGAFTAQFVLKFTDANDFSMVLTKSNGIDATDIQYEIRRAGGATGLEQVGGPGGTLAAVATATGLSLTSYHVYTVVTDPGGISQWYVDGVASGAAKTWSPSGTWAATANDVLIGARASGGVLQPYTAPMLLLELNLYTGALDATTRHGTEEYLGADYAVAVT